MACDGGEWRLLLLDLVVVGVSRCTEACGEARRRWWFMAAQATVAGRWGQASDRCGQQSAGGAAPKGRGEGPS